jgi:Fe-S oxidoreductase
MFKQELPLLFPGDADVKAVQDAMFDPFEYFVLRNRDGLLKKDFKQPLGKVSYHIPCHSRVQNMGQKTRELLEMIPGTKVTTVERCAGHDGTWGVKTEYFENSMKIGRPVFRLMADGRARLDQLGLPDRRAPYSAREWARKHPAAGKRTRSGLLRKAYAR